MSKHESATITEVTWAKVRDRVDSVNPEFAAIVDRLEPGPDYSLFKVRYPYGADFLKTGELQIPNAEGDLVPVTHPGVAENVRFKLGYSAVPLGICLNTSGEVYVNMDERIIPVHSFKPGSVFGLWEVLEPRGSAFAKRIWNIAVGARSLFMLPKISDHIGLNRLSKAYDLKILVSPKSIFEQHALFTEIAHSANIENKWHSEILFFSSKWFEPDLDNNAWLRFQHFMLHKEWLQNIYWRNKATFELIGQAFASAQSSKNLRANTYLIDTVMYLISLGVSANPGFAPVVENDQSAGPVKVLQQAFVEHYGLRNYIPTLLKPKLLDQHDNDSVYYSLQIPTALASSPSNRTPHSVLQDLRMVKRLLEALQQKLAEDHPSIFSLIQNIEYTFFHSESDAYYDIHSTIEIPNFDPRMLDNPYAKGREFCDTASFLRGCVKVSRNVK